VPFTATIPRAVQLVLDDVGWREGWRLDDEGGPWRAGVDRLMVTEDYHAIAEIGARLNVRPQAAMVLCEWDKENTCAECPTCTHAGADWDNSSRAGEWSDEAAEVFRSRAAHIELAMHGVGHEHWENGERTRAEWYHAAKDQRWEWDALLKHLEVFRRILDQHNLGPDAGHALPPSAVPCAFNYYFDDGDPHSTGALFRAAGVERVSTPFGGGFHQVSPLAAPDGGFEHGLPVIDRSGNRVPYDAFDSVPEAPTPNSICGIHWPNVLAPDPAENERALDAWLEYLAAIDAQPDMMLAANSTECFAQWAYHSFVQLKQRGDTLSLDASAMPDGALPHTARAPLWLKLSAPSGTEVSAVRAEGLTAVGYRRDRDCILLGLSGVRQQRADLRLTLSGTLLDPVVLRTGTTNVLDITGTLDTTFLTLEVYGRQEVALRTLTDVSSLSCSNPRVSASIAGSDRPGRLCTLSLSTDNIHGETTTLTLRHVWPRVATVPLH